MAILEVLACRYFSQVKGLWQSCPLRRTSLVNCRYFTAQTDSKPSHEDTAYEDGIKNKILESSLPFVNKYGWSVTAISKGAVSLGYPGIINGIFSNASVELIDYYNKKCNRELNENMIAAVDVSEGAPNPKKIIENAIQIRLKMVIPYIEKWPQALAIMSIPMNLPLAVNTFSTLVDDICYYSGDHSVDFNWYCRRGAVSLIYKSTELCMLQDRSENFIETWRFLERRTDEAFKIHNILKTNENVVNTMKEVTLATFTTLSNVLCLSRKY